METLAARREFSIKNLEQRKAEIEQEMLDAEFAERLVSNADWQALCRVYRKAAEARTTGLEEAKTRFFKNPLKPEDAAFTREYIMLGERDRLNMEEFLGYPAKLAKELKDLRENLEQVTVDLKRLKGEL